MNNIKTTLIIMAITAVIGGLFIMIVKDTEEMSQQYNQCLEQHERRVCDNIYYR